MSDLWCYPTAGKRKAFQICRNFAIGSGGEIAELNQTKLNPGAAFFYGWTSHTIALIRECQARGIDWYYADNAYYFGRGRFFRVTKNSFMHDGQGNAGPERFRNFGIRVKPWRHDGASIVVTTQSELFYPERLGCTRDAWVNDVTTELRRHTDRDIVVCWKPDATTSGNAPAAETFVSELKDAWALVTHSSSTAVKAVIEGVPVFSLAASMASCMGLDDLARIEEPIYPDDREPWLWNLAANQWTKAEMRDGPCWLDLQREAIRGDQLGRRPGSVRGREDPRRAGVVRGVGGA